MKKELKEEAKEILELAKSYGTEQNLFFATTFERYQTQLEILEELKATIESEGFFVDKTYVKGKSNLYTHPAVTQYNRTTDSANKTVVTLMKIITTLRERQDGEEADPLLEILRGKASPGKKGHNGGNARNENGAEKEFNCSRLENNASGEPNLRSETDTR